MADLGMSPISGMAITHCVVCCSGPLVHTRGTAVGSRKSAGPQSHGSSLRGCGWGTRPHRYVLRLWLLGEQTAGALQLVVRCHPSFFFKSRTAQVRTLAPVIMNGSERCAAACYSGTSRAILTEGGLYRVWRQAGGPQASHTGRNTDSRLFQRYATTSHIYIHPY